MCSKAAAGISVWPEPTVVSGVLGSVETGEVVKVQILKVPVNLVKETHSIPKGVWRVDKNVRDWSVFTSLILGVAGRVDFMDL